MDDEFWTAERLADFAKQVAEQVVQLTQKGDDPYLTAEEIADLLHLSSNDPDATTPLDKRKRDAVDYYRRKTNFPEHKIEIGNQRLWERAKVLAWVDEYGRDQKRRRKQEGPKAAVGAAALKVMRKLQEEEEAGLLDAEPDNKPRPRERS